MGTVWLNGRNSDPLKAPREQATVYPRSGDPFYIVSYYIKWVTTSWTHSTIGPIKGKVRRFYMGGPLNRV